MAISPDGFTKHWFVEAIGELPHGMRWRIFPDSSNADQLSFSDGGLTFGVDGTPYGSCDAAIVVDEDWVDPLTGTRCEERPVLVFELTDGLNRNQSGNGQYQRFHHALGSLRAGIPSVYFLRPGASKVQETLYGMAHFATCSGPSVYLVSDDIETICELIDSWDGRELSSQVLSELGRAQFNRWSDYFRDKYDASLEKFSQKRSTVLFANYAVKHAGRNTRNFTDGSQRAGHIAVGEMYVSKYIVGNRGHVFYLFPRMTNSDIAYLDKTKGTDKEWRLLRNEGGVTILGIDDLDNVPNQISEALASVKNSPLKGDALRKYTSASKELETLLRSGAVTVNRKSLNSI